MDLSPYHTVFEPYLNIYFDQYKSANVPTNQKLLLKYDGESLGIPNNIRCPSFCSFCEGIFNNSIYCLECANYFHKLNGNCVPDCGAHFYLDTEINECFGIYLILIYIYIECDETCTDCYGTNNTDCTNCESRTETPFLCLVDIINERGKCVQSCTGCITQNHETYSTPNKCECIIYIYIYI